jgi:hypothetical protein
VIVLPVKVFMNTCIYQLPGQKYAKFKIPK